MTLNRLLSPIVALLAAIAAAPTFAITTSQNQVWNFEPDAWARANTTDTSYFGWDLMESAGFGPMGSGFLDDTTPDLGVPTTAGSPRIAQSQQSRSVFGHRSGSGNYYSGFQGNAFADDTITAVAPTPAGQSGGFTTVVLQVIGQPTNAISDLSFAMDTSSVAWIKQKDLYAVQNGAGVYWQEWSAPGDNLPFSVHMTSASSSRGIDAFQVDAFWSATGPAANAIVAIPEPSTFALAGLALIAMAARSASRRK